MRALPHVPNLNFLSPSFSLPSHTASLRPRQSSCLCRAQNYFIHSGFPHTVTLWNPSYALPPLPRKHHLLFQSRAQLSPSQESCPQIPPSPKRNMQHFVKADHTSPSLFAYVSFFLQERGFQGQQPHIHINAHLLPTT